MHGLHERPKVYIHIIMLTLKEWFDGYKGYKKRKNIEDFDHFFKKSSTIMAKFKTITQKNLINKNCQDRYMSKE